MARIIVLFFILLSTASYSQLEKIHRLQHFDKSKVRYGFYIGINQKGYALKKNDDVTATANSGSGFQLGVLADYNITNNISLIAEPGVMSSRNQITFGGKTFDLNNTYFRVPVSLKLSTDRINNIKTFAKAGLGINYNFSSEENIDKEDYAFELAKTTISAEIAVGMSFYFPYFKFSPSIRGIYGINSEMRAIGSIAKTEAPYGLYQRGVFLNLTFQ